MADGRHRHKGYAKFVKRSLEDAYKQHAPHQWVLQQIERHMPEAIQKGSPGAGVRNALLELIRPEFERRNLS